jgi:nonribosomal peptide synthetase protein BlmX
MAQNLRNHGVGRESVVALHLLDPLSEILAILAVHLAGAAYLPVYSGLPPARVARILQASGAGWLIGDASDPGYPLPRFTRSLPFEQLMWPLSTLPPLDLAADADNLAYVIYTSGSTGEPRGVMISHRNLVQSLGSRLEHYRAAGEEVFLLIPACSSDSSVAIIFWSLASGGKLVLRESKQGVECPEVEEIIARESITDLLLTPSLYGALLQEAAAERIASLRRVMVAGETAHAALESAHRRLLTATELVNEYGPTEATVWSSAWESKQAGSSGSLPIGNSCRHCHLQLVDGFHLPTMAGQAGEILIGGSGIARGYLGDRAATAARFVPDPSGGPGARRYVSGDIARQLPGGALEFLGRRDRQLEVNGFRLELAEIENALLCCRGVREAAAVADELAGRTVVSAFAVTSAADPLEGEALLSQLGQLLPRHAIPAECSIVVALPKNTNGKIDYLRLGRERQDLVQQAMFERALRQVETLTELEAELAIEAEHPVRSI